ncbi:MAG: RHS repeat protein, partial [Lachnospiraceae bacterium]|nr:RHS repeat protein [Lachnospiraceae bacterium]
MYVKEPEGCVTSYTYNALGLVLTETDPLGNVISYEYDMLGQTTARTDALGNRMAFSYTADGQIASVTDAEGNITRYTYDACGNLIQTEDAMGSIVQYAYDAMNNQIRECLSVSGEQSCITLYQYDKKGRMIKEINPLLEEKVYTYDGNDNLTVYQDEEQKEIAVRYDLNDQPVSIAYSDDRRAAFRYNKRGELVEMSDWNGTVSLERDSVGRLTKVTDHHDRVTGYAYDAAGNRTGISYPDGSAAAYAYDKNNRLVSVTDGEEKSAQYTYDAAGNMTFFTGPAGSVSYTYNANRQPVGMAYRLGESTVMEERLTYDRTGRITSSERTGSSPELTGSADYGYDSNELMVYETGAGSIRSVFGHSYECLSETVTSETQAAGTETASGSPVPE